MSQHGNFKWLQISIWHDHLLKCPWSQVFEEILGSDINWRGEGKPSGAGLATIKRRDSSAQRASGYQTLGHQNIIMACTLLVLECITWRRPHSILDCRVSNNLGCKNVEMKRWDEGTSCFMTIILQMQCSIFWVGVCFHEMYCVLWCEHFVPVEESETTESREKENSREGGQPPHN